MASIKRALTLGIGTATAVACMLGGASGVHAGSACTVWTDASGDQRSLIPGRAGPQLDLVKGTFDVSGTTLAVRMYVQDMSTTPPLGAHEIYWDTWVTPTALVYATATEFGDVFFFDQEWTGPDGAPPIVDHADTGTIVAGPGGYAEIDVPLANLGISSGDRLTGITAQTSMLDLEGLDYEITDNAAAQSTWVVGSTC